MKIKNRLEEREQKIQFFWDFNSILVCLISHSIEIEFLKQADGCANKIRILGGVLKKTNNFFQSFMQMP